MPYWVDTNSKLRLAIAARPRGGDWLGDEIAALKRDGVDVLVSLLTREEESELLLNAESEVCETCLVDFRQFSIPDRQVPSSSADFIRFVDSIREDAQTGRSIAAHCRAGIGRSSLLIASLMRREGFEVEDAFRRISAARGLQVPDTPEQVTWVQNLKLNS